MEVVNDVADGAASPPLKNVHPHAFHVNMPKHHYDTDDGVPLITKYAHKKSRYIVALSKSLKLTESMFVEADAGGNIDQLMDDMQASEDGVQDDLDEDVIAGPDTLPGFVRTCSRLQSLMSSLESLKHSGLSQKELCDMALHFLTLVSASLTIDQGSDGNRTASIHYEQVGYIQTFGSGSNDDKKIQDDQQVDAAMLEQELQENFALPYPAREVLLSMIINILSNKGPMRSISNAAVRVDGQSDDEERFLLILSWKALLRMLLRTSCYLDEYKMGTPPLASISRQNTVRKRTVQLIRDARHYFDQGLVLAKERGNTVTDCTAIEIWDMVKVDVMNRTTSHACYRGLILLYLFMPTRCSPAFYEERMPTWFNCWTNVDRCPEMDFLWLTLFCRARKHLPADYEWGPIRRRLLTHCQYWLQLPIGGASLDKSFPRAPAPRSRTCPPRLKIFAGTSSSYEEGIDFVAKVAKLLAVCLGAGEKSEVDGLSEGTRDVLRFMTFVTPYFNPSNLGSWTFTLGAFLHYFSYEICCRVGMAGSIRALHETNPQLLKAITHAEPIIKNASIPPHEIVRLVDSLLPLCQQALYSKNGHVGRAGEAAMLYLTQIDPARVTPTFIDFAMRALDISAVNLAHQAPAALSALTRLVQPALRSNPTILLARLPDLLRLTLAGIDSNDQNKTIRTLILYRNIASWIPIGDVRKHEKCAIVPPISSKDDRSGSATTGIELMKYLHAHTSESEYVETVQQLPETSLLRQGESLGDVDMDLLFDEASSELSDWVLEFLERVFSLLRASGEREKTGKNSSGVASRHSSVDVQQARNFSRVMKECLMQAFASMDDYIHKLAVKTVVKFLYEETLPSAAKDMAYLCQSVAAVRCIDGEYLSPGLDALVPVLLDDITHNSNKTTIYRLRCLAGAIRSCGHGIHKHQAAIESAIDFALKSKDRHVFKMGCKLLRHTLAALCEPRPLASDTSPRVHSNDDKQVVLGISAQLANDPVKWCVPDAPSLEFAWDLLRRHVLERIKAITADSGGNLDGFDLRRCLRVIRYSLRGGAGILLDFEDGETAPNNSDVVEEDERNDVSYFPYEMAMQQLLRSAVSDSTYSSILRFRGQLCSFIVSLMSVIASQTFSLNSSAGVKDSDTEEKTGDALISDKEYREMISTDAKICKESCDISLLLLTRRGASFRSQEAKTIWKAHKQLSADFTLLSQADHVTESLQRAHLYRDPGVVFFKDGENAGKTLPRRLLVTRVQLFHDSMQRTASFEIPRRLRRLSMLQKSARKIQFTIDTSAENFCASAGKVTDVVPSPLDSCEGLVDGLFSLCCHSNTQVRAAGIGVVDYAITRFGWLVRPRVPRLLSAIQLSDVKMHGRFGLPSCALLINEVDAQGKRKRLSEAMKGVCSIIAIPRAGKQLLGTEKTRAEFMRTICDTDSLVSKMPAEEMQKMVHYFHSIFNPFRSKFYNLRRSGPQDQQIHEASLEYLLDVLSTEKENGDAEDESEAKAAHWRKLLLASWFMTAFIDQTDLLTAKSEIRQGIWNTCFRILENEPGQPLQRVALGLFGRLVTFDTLSDDQNLLKDRMTTESFCQVLGNALMYDHKEDSSVGGGHDAQWSAGVTDIIRDSARHIAPRSLFPFQRINQVSGTFKVSHSQLVELALLKLGKEKASEATKHLIAFASELASSPPSEDQRNEQCTSAEIFAGVARALMQLVDRNEASTIWISTLVPFLDDVIPKIPISISGAFFDGLRYAVQFSHPDYYLPLTTWLIGKIESSLWQPKADADQDEKETEDANGKAGAGQGTDGFTAQTKWLYHSCALLVELDETAIDDSSARKPWYTASLATRVPATDVVSQLEEAGQTWRLVVEKLIPRLVEALGHPYDSCRDNIAGCLFRICYSYRKIMTEHTILSEAGVSNTTLAQALQKCDPGKVIVEKLTSLQSSDDPSFQNRYNSLLTARRFISYCVHFGEAKLEHSDYIIPLLPLVFDSLKSTVDDDTEGVEADNVAKRALEADVVKGYRYTIAELSIASVNSHGNNSDITNILKMVTTVAEHEFWQIRHAVAHFSRCFQGSHKFLFTTEHSEQLTSIVVGLLADDRREVSSAAMAAMTGILAALPSEKISALVKKYVSIANKSRIKRKKASAAAPTSGANAESIALKEQKRAKSQQSSVFFLCAAVLSQPYETPLYVPAALAAISKHSFERSAPLGIRDTVKKCCAEYKRTHMSDNWEVHRKIFTQEQLEALEDVVSSPHYYA